MANAAGLTNTTALVAGAAARSLHRMGSSSSFSTLLQTLPGFGLTSPAGSYKGGLQPTISLGSNAGSRTPRLARISSSDHLSPLGTPGSYGSSDFGRNPFSAAAGLGTAALAATGKAGSSSVSKISDDGVAERVELAVKAFAALFGLGGLLPLLGPDGRPLALDAYGRLVVMPGKNLLKGGQRHCRA